MIPGSSPYGYDPYGWVPSEEQPGTALPSGAFSGAPWASCPWAGDPEPVFPVAGSAENIWFLDALALEGAAISTAQAALVPVVNLLDAHPTRKWRSPGQADAITFVTPRAVAATGLAMVNPNWSTMAFWRLRGAATVEGLLASSVVDTNWRSPWPLGIKPDVEEWINHTCLLRWANTVPLRYWRLDIVDAGVDRLDAGRLLFGVGWQPLYNVDYGLALTLMPSDIQIRGEYGGIYTEKRFTGRQFKLPFPGMDYRDAQDHAIELQRRLGLARDLVCSIDPAETADLHKVTIHGVLSTPGSYQGQAWFGRYGLMTWQADIQIDELLW